MDLPLPNPIKDNLKVQLADFLRLQFKELIEEKHLYQNILIDHEKMFKNETVKKTSGSK